MRCTQRMINEIAYTTGQLSSVASQRSNCNAKGSDTDMTYLIDRSLPLEDGFLGPSPWETGARRTAVWGFVSLGDERIRGVDFQTTREGQPKFAFESENRSVGHRSRAFLSEESITHFCGYRVEIWSHTQVIT